MNVSELINELEACPGDAQVEAMFPTGTDCYVVSGTELFELAQGRKAVVINIHVGPQLASA